MPFRQVHSAAMSTKKADLVDKTASNRRVAWYLIFGVDQIPGPKMTMGNFSHVGHILSSLVLRNGHPMCQTC